MTDIDDDALNSTAARSVIRRVIEQARRLDEAGDALVARVLEDSSIRQTLTVAAASVAIVLAAALPTDATDTDDVDANPTRHAHAIVAEAKAPTTRELEAIALISEGLSHKQVAERLNISRHTVANHVAHVRTKLNATGAEHAVAIAIRSGLV